MGPAMRSSARFSLRRVEVALLLDDGRWRSPRLRRRESWGQILGTFRGRNARVGMMAGCRYGKRHTVYRNQCPRMDFADADSAAAFTNPAVACWGAHPTGRVSALNRSAIAVRGTRRAVPRPCEAELDAPGSTRSHAYPACQVSEFAVDAVGLLQMRQMSDAVVPGRFGRGTRGKDVLGHCR